jgi:N-acetylglucosamine kinase-like BadF-type ATPase
MPTYLGLDCGGSSTRALALNENCAVLHTGHAGPANLASTPPKRLEANVKKAAEGCPAPDFIAGCFAGLLTSDDRARAIELLQQIAPQAKIRAEPDYVAALMACEPDTDLCLVGGTGSLVCSRIGDKVVRSGGGGYLLGDVGSACQYGRAALQHFLIAGPEHASENLKGAVLKHFETLEENEVLAKLYRGGAPAARLAKLAPVFSKEAANGEPYAQQALREQTAAMASIVRAHVDRYHPEKRALDICLAGGLWEAGAVFQSQLEAALGVALSEIELRFSRIARPPVQGAVRLAQELES